LQQAIKSGYLEYVKRKCIVHYRSISDKSIIGYFILLLCSAALIIPVSAITLTPGSSTAGSATISNGDPVYINGIATGHPQNGLQVWFIGYNTAKISNVAVNEDNTYTYELKSADTQNLASGQYLVIVQHPMMNGQFDIVYSPADGKVINKQLGTGTSIFQLTSGGSLQSTDAATALMRAINSQNIDDTFATASFYINPPQARISPIGDHRVGDKFTIAGSTNLAVGDKLQVDVYSSSFVPTSKSQSGEYSGASGVVEVKQGSIGYNQWSFEIDTSGFKPDEYLVKVAGITQDVTGSTTFNILQPLPATTQVPQTLVTTVPVTTPASAIVTTPVERTQAPMTTHSAMPLWISGCGVLATIAILNLKK